MTDWTTFMTAAAEEEDIERLRQTLSAANREVDRLTTAATRLRQRLEPMPAEEAEPPPRIDKSSFARDIAEWKLARFKARRKFRVADAARRPESLRDAARVIRDVIRELLTSSTLPPRPEPVVIPEPGPHPYLVARSLIDSGDHERALRVLDEFDPEQQDRVALLLRRDACFGVGAVSEAIRILEQFLALGRDNAIAQQLRQLQGRLTETDTEWLPSLPTSAPVQPEPGVIVHLVKESVPYFHRGYTIRSHNTFLAQRSIGLQPEVVTHLGFPRTQGIEDFPIEEIVDGIRYHRLDLGPHYPYLGMPFDMVLDDHATASLRIANEVRPEFVQAGSGYRGYETALVGLAVARRLSVPFVYEIRSFFESTWTGDPNRATKGEQYERRYAQELRCLLEADHVITISDSMRAELIGRGVPERSITVVPNAIDPGRFHPRPRRGDLAEALDLHGSSVIGYVSNLGKREGHDDLISAGSLMRSWGLQVKVLIVGEGPERERLEEHALELGMMDHVVFTGAVRHDDIADYYSLIDVFVVPRLDERVSRLVTPLKPLEAMALGIPVIASDLPALREMIEPGVRGELFEPSSVEDMAKVALGLMEDTERANELTNAAAEWVRTERTWDVNAEIYAQVIKGLRSPP